MKTAVALLALLLTLSCSSALSQAPARPIKVSPGIMAGNILKRVSPVYPGGTENLKVKGFGWVTVNAIIGTDGSVEQASIIESLSGGVPQELWSSALDAAKQYQYKPYLMNGQPVRVATYILVKFTDN